MKLAVTFTVNNRPEYFAKVLESWTEVRGKEDVIFNFSCEHLRVEAENASTYKMAQDWIRLNGVRGRAYYNMSKFGVLHNPYVALQRAFSTAAEYAILAEDDLLVSDDILEYHKWTSNEYVDDKEIGAVCSFTDYEGTDTQLADVVRVPRFQVLTWGTWQDRWEEYIEPTWDHDYSTYNETPGNQAGWDWNINTRVFPALGKKCIHPFVSRAQNIGAVGTHSPQGSWYITAPDWQSHHEPVEFREV